MPERMICMFRLDDPGASNGFIRSSALPLMSQSQGLSKGSRHRRRWQKRSIPRWRGRRPQQSPGVPFPAEDI
ncbi:Kelchlike family member 2, partial [Caligus rogercresseyi]